jgi:hypothetical protein
VRGRDKDATKPNVFLLVPAFDLSVEKATMEEGGINVRGG